MKLRLSSGTLLIVREISLKSSLGTVRLLKASGSTEIFNEVLLNLKVFKLFYFLLNIFQSSILCTVLHIKVVQA